MAWIFLDETRRLRTMWRFAIFGMGFLFVQIVIGLVVAVGFVIYLVATGDSPNSFLGSPQSMEKWLTPLQIIAALPITLGSLGLVLICRKYVDRRDVWSLGLARPGRAVTQSVAGGFVIGCLPIIFIIGILLFTGGLKWVGVAGSLQTALLVPALVAMAFCEEIVCRGYLLQNLVDIRRPLFGILFSSAVFSLLHAFNPAFMTSPLIGLNLFGAGVTLALAYRASGNIWFPTALHFGWNFAQGVLFEVPVSGIRTDGLLDVRIVDTAPVWLTGGAFGIEGSVLTTFAELWMSVLLGGVMLRRARQSAIHDSSPNLENG